MEHKPITTQDEYDKVAARIEQLKDGDAGSEEAEELKLLTKLIIAYESKRQQPEE
ncbi:hypothetical protein [Pontibacter diazotrophicus]|uniref:hypothetical protein n=1 Tax=Pontibacter diazotrophicus TaxID=1400979 RepID=UPI0015F16CD6|nr:hypothetical protein [Pontibacter diazotrophicus]